MAKTKTFPIQGEYGRRVSSGAVRNFQSTHVDWRLGELAYSYYAKRNGTSQSLERLAQRAGFGVAEFAFMLLGALGYEIDEFNGTVAPPKQSRSPWLPNLKFDDVDT